MELYDEFGIHEGEIEDTNIHFEITEEVKKVLDECPLPKEMWRSSLSHQVILENTKSFHEYLDTKVDRFQLTGNTFKKQDRWVLMILYLTNYNTINSILELNTRLANPFLRGKIKKVMNWDKEPLDYSCCCSKKHLKYIFEYSEHNEYKVIMGSSCVLKGFILNDEERKSIKKAFADDMCRTCHRKGTSNTNEECVECAKTLRKCLACKRYVIGIHEPHWKIHCCKAPFYCYQKFKKEEIDRFGNPIS